jgi:hypothetical protein
MRKLTRNALLPFTTLVDTLYFCCSNLTNHKSSCALSSGFTAFKSQDGEKCYASVVNFPLVVLATNTSNSGRYAKALATSVSMTTLERARSTIGDWSLAGRS